MFGFLRGTVAVKGPDRVHLDVHGAGYEVFVPDTVHRRLAVGREATLLTHCHIREDVFQIYGFLREEEKALFRLLLGVSGIGPKVALGVMSAMAPSEFARAIHDSDVTAFTRVGGVGKKTAQRIVLEVKAKLGQDAELSAILGEEAPADDGAADDVIAALMALGCTHAEAKRAAANARKQLGDTAPAEELVKAALRAMARV
jgi:Holliday junction DNA helicase RuvA